MAESEIFEVSLVVSEGVHQQEARTGNGVVTQTQDLNCQAKCLSLFLSLAYLAHFPSHLPVFRFLAAPCFTQTKDCYPETSDTGLEFKRLCVVSIIFDFFILIFCISVLLVGFMLPHIFHEVIFF